MKTLRPAKIPKKAGSIEKNYYVFDVETTKLEPLEKNFVFGVVYGYKYKKIIYSVTDFRAEFSKERYNGKYIFAHNAEFDLLTIYGNIYTSLDRSAIFNGKFISAKYEKKTFVDSLNIYPSSVKKIGETIGMEKIDNKKISSEGLRINNITEKDIEYCITDCEIIYVALLKIFSHIGVIKVTLASLVMFNFRNKYLSENLHYSSLNDEFYESYYGGRTEAFKIGQVNATVYDINSMYPDTMQKIKFPDVKNLRKETKVDVRYLLYLLKRYEGLAKVKVRHHETYFGYLPKRHKVNKSEKLIFPVGTFITTVNFNELRFALERNVISIISVEYVVYGNGIDSPFKKFIQDNYSARAETKNALDKLIYKLKMNSLYGRFAMRMKYTSTYYDLIPYEIIEELQETEKFYELKLFSAKREDCFIVTESDNFVNSFFAIPSFSSYITSACRVKILKSLLDNENEEVVYCDTDSIFLKGSFNGSLSEQLGDWKLEAKNITEIRGLKNYTYLDSEGQTKDVIKGISKNSKKIGVGKFKQIKYYKTKQALRQNKEAGEQFEQIKELKHKYDKRTVDINGNTKPLKL